ncbi:amino acid ABC transporter substrate-binding protein [Pseudomonas alcaligenes]|uniref:Amino acid ABC transporter substrate-binding protein n=1 Tax=Aquipseudomonas alcaligenes TaxID=43263 RepID=A0ABR7RX70_AQUAC|nr:transporter substrate-binding domain-containing protein [Pseudomonas alcaligenes]MBC9249935.1 amino acid ABC transporter substrate-binding protein [Pseudomonas alcaligenes]
MRLLPLLFLALCSISRAETISLTNGEWSPYLGEHLPYHGVVSRIIEEAFAFEGIQVKWLFYPWPRALRTAANGNSAGTAVWRRSPEKEQIFFISDPVVDTSYYFFHRQDHPFDWQQISDLQGKRIGGAIDYNYGAAFQQAEKSGQVQMQRLSNEELALRMLLAGRLDVLPMDKVVAFDLLHSKFSAAERRQLTFHPLPLNSDTLHLLLSRKVAGNEALLQRFNLGLQKLRNSGKVAQYLLEVQQPVSLVP